VQATFDLKNIFPKQLKLSLLKVTFDDIAIIFLQNTDEFGFKMSELGQERRRPAAEREASMKYTTQNLRII
jgi:hypothetical protein